ncbi:hypothetical protein SapgrDRAFT_2354 [Saprospira grandis DSM 2844]|uniref:Uncharacterized protein n=1 Tax=Saprospira grandis DSM 2844 TaxID=694433 RepID=J1I5G5_9BACT|nr:hypothetical protein [Saprospira grandis]EJF54020.1 hypothetical protein SapgrDRAFT_2354 [Saprospira grandis DSM 2844]
MKEDFDKFDEYSRKLFNDFEAEAHHLEEDWMKFEARLDASQKKDEQLDQLVLAALGDFEANELSMEEDWDRLQTDLDLNAEETEELDALARQALAAYAATEEEMPEDWSRLEAALEEKKDRPAVFWFKTMEAGLLLLSLFTLINLFYLHPMQEEATGDKGQSSKTNTANDLAQNSPSAKTQSGQKDSQASFSAGENTALTNALRLSEEPQQIAMGSPLLQKQPAGAFSASFGAGAKLPPFIQGQNFAKAAAGAQANLLATSQEKTAKQAENSGQVEGTEEDARPEDSNQKEEQNKEAAVFAALDLEDQGLSLANYLAKKDSNDLDKLKGDLSFQLKSPYSFPKVYNRHRHLGLYTGLNLGLGETANLGSGQAGLQFGLQLEQELNKKWGLSLGLFWQQQNYALFEQSSLLMPDGLSYSRQINKEERLQLLQLPLQLRYSLYIDNKWELQALAAGLYQLSLQRQQRGQEELIGQQAAGQILQRSYLPTDSPNSALLQEGSWANNQQFALQLGLGLDRQLGDHYRLSLQAHYLRQLAQNEQMAAHHFQLLVGLKYRLP